jgi:transcriptional regulator with XRE-family HTH domain
MSWELDKDQHVEKFFDFTDKEFRDAYIEESLIANTQAEICLLLKSKKVSRAELARRLGVSAPHVSQMLGDEDANLTLRTLARIYAALGEEAFVCAKPRNAEMAPETKSAMPFPRERGIDCWSQTVESDPWEKGENEDAQQLESTASSSAVVIWFEQYRNAA